MKDPIDDRKRLRLRPAVKAHQASDDQVDRPAGGVSRRRMLGGMAAGAGAVALGPTGVLGRPAAAVAEEARPGGLCTAAGSQNFGRMFPGLPSFAKPSAQLYAALLDIGKAGGILDAKDELGAGPKNLIIDPALSLINRDNPTHTAGVTFMGQFMDHDVTFDASSALYDGKASFAATEPEAARNFRTPAFNLDTVYGDGFVAGQLLYDPANRAKLRIGTGGRFEDMPRDENGTAIIGDPRNDENLVVSGLHQAFILFHNNAVDGLRQAGVTETGEAFARARQLTTWHYHWMILHQFLPLFVGQGTVNDVLRQGPRFYRPRAGAFMPVEFQGAAYRFGHSMVRPSYRANLAGDTAPGNVGGPFFGFVFDPSNEGSADPADLRGGFRSPRRFIGWQTFFDFGDGQAKFTKRIDTKISTPLMNLPLGVIASHDGPTSLPQRNLLRQVTWSLPSGQLLAQRMGMAPLSPGDLRELAGYGLGLERSTPLWYYGLKEAEVTQDGLRLGPVAGRIVAEVIIGLLQLDPESYLRAQPSWQPTLSSHLGRGQFDMVDFLTLAGVAPDQRGQ